MQNLAKITTYAGLGQPMQKRVFTSVNMRDIN